MSAYEHGRITKIPAYKKEDSCCHAGYPNLLETKHFCRLMLTMIFYPLQFKFTLASNSW